MQPMVGIGCTASLASDLPKRGAHRIHVAVQSASATVTHSVELTKGRRTRGEEEDVAARLVLNSIAEAFGIDDQMPLRLIENEQVQCTHTVAPTEWQALLLGRTSKVNTTLLVEGQRPPENDQKSTPSPSALPRAILSGAFNPLHHGHIKIAQLASQKLGTPVAFELSIENVDKPLLDYTAMEQRARQFVEKALPLWFTRAPTFVEKSRLFPGATFLVGADTLARIGQPRYYHDDPAAAASALRQIAEQGCRFLVFGRLVEGRFQTLDDLQLPTALRNLCDPVPTGEFRDDVSSTDLRQTAHDPE